MRGQCVKRDRVRLNGVGKEVGRGRAIRERYGETGVKGRERKNA